MKQKKRNEISDNYKWDLTTIYKNDAAFYEEYEIIKEKISKFSIGNVFENGKSLYDFLEKESNISVIIDKLYTYAHLNNDADTTDSFYDEMSKKVLNLYDAFSKKLSFFEPNLLKLDYSKILEFYQKFPKLKKYEIYLQELFRFKKHILSEEEEKLMTELSRSLNSSSDTYEKLTDTDMSFGFIKDEFGKRVELTESNYTSFLQSKNRNVRKQAFKKLLSKYGEFIHSISSTYSGYVNTLNALSNIYRYENPLEQALFRDDISVDVYDSLIETVNENMNVIYKYYDFRNRKMGLKKSHIYDTYVEIVDEVGPKYTFEEARDIVLDALKVLGDDYINVMKKAFTEHWIDVYNNKGKRGGAYSSGSYLTNPFLLLNFEGRYNDISTLAHELGHSMHSYYSNKNDYIYSGYQIFVAEIASTVNEMILAKYMLKNGDKLTQKIVINNLLGLFKSTIYRQTMFAEFEKNMVLDSKKGVILTSDYLCENYYKLVKKYFGKNVIIDDEIKYEWARIPHFYYHFYVYKYATGLSIASYIASEIMNGNKQLLKKYRDFLKIGGKMNPKEALMTMNIDITKKDVVKKAIDLFDEFIKEADEILK